MKQMLPAFAGAKPILPTLTIGGLAYTLGESRRWELLAMRAMRCLACRCCRWYCMYMKMTMHRNTTPNVHAVMIRNLDISSMGGNVTPVMRKNIRSMNVRICCDLVPMLKAWVLFKNVANFENMCNAQVQAAKKKKKKIKHGTLYNMERKTLMQMCTG